MAVRTTSREVGLFHDEETAFGVGRRSFESYFAEAQSVCLAQSVRTGGNCLAFGRSCTDCASAIEGNRESTHLHKITSFQGVFLESAALI